MSQGTSAGLARETLQKILSVALVVYDGREEMEKVDTMNAQKRTEEQENNLWVAVLTRSLQARGGNRGVQGRGKSDPGSGSRKRDWIKGEE